VKTSKLMLAVWLALGGALALRGVGEFEAAVWALGAVITVWNRLDSRAKGYKASVSVAGVEASVDVADSGPPSEAKTWF
jgi:hypothetical protein